MQEGTHRENAAPCIIENNRVFRGLGADKGLC